MAIVQCSPCLAIDGIDELKDVEGRVREEASKRSNSLELLWTELVRGYSCQKAMYGQVDCVPPSASPEASVISQISWRKISQAGSDDVTEFLSVRLRKFDLNAPPTVRREVFGAWRERQSFSLHAPANCSVQYLLPRHSPGQPVVEALLLAAGPNCDLDVTGITFVFRPSRDQAPNQSLEPTRVGKPPLAAQLQR